MDKIKLECVICGAEATKTNNTLCQDCWNDAECACDDQEYGDALNDDILDPNY